MGMKKVVVMAATVLLLSGQGSLVFSAIPTDPDATYNVTVDVADRLVSNQITIGPDAGSWRSEQAYVGSIVPGLVEAYQLTGNEEYKTAAEAGGEWILANGTSCNFYGDEAYALMRLSEISCDPEDNQWRTALAAFFECVRGQPAYPPYVEAGTVGYIKAFAYGTDVTTAVFYLSHLTRAAYYVDAVDKAVWRDWTIHFLAQVDDDADMNVMPVMALGVATWAIAETGPLDNTPVKIFGTGVPYWNFKHLSDLPTILQSHRSPTTVFLFGGSFYYRFDHQFGCGYTEDNIYGLMGLKAAQERDPSLNFEEDIKIVRAKLLEARDDEGYVYGHVDHDIIPNYKYYHFSGEFLGGIGKVAYRGDIDLDDSVDFDDMTAMAESWLWTSDTCVYGINVSDVNRDGIVNFLDFALLAQNLYKSY